MHNVAIALDGKALRHFDRADCGDTTDVVATRSSSIRCSAHSFFVGEQFCGERGILVLRRPAPTGAGDRTDGDDAVTHPHQDLRRRANDLEAAEIEVAEKRRRVDSPQRAIEREGRQGERRGEPLR
jgi:hypothetical protein